MSFLNDTYCQICERFVTKEQLTNHLYYSRHLHREVNGYQSDYFRQRKLTKHENIILEKAFWKMFFATRDIKEVEEFWFTSFIMATKTKDYFLEKNEEENRKDLRACMEGQFELNLYNKSFSNQLESDDDDDDDDNDTLQGKIDWWMAVVFRGVPIPDNIYDYTVDELFMLYR